jgi:uncharacterized phage protein (TIGR01671 family)
MGDYMRDIKFRAWDKEKKMMIFPNDSKKEGLVLTYNGNLKIHDIDERDIIWFHKPEDKGIILMQYTGLKDKNGKEIYEGDILKLKCRDPISEEWREWICPIEFRKGFYHPLPFEEGIIEVIGNIYENKELLKNDSR